MEPTVKFTAQLAVYYDFTFEVPASEVAAEGFDADAAAEAAYSDGEDWGTLEDHELSEVIEFREGR